ncbi:unnamed protein product, partial [Adineta steineri]
IVLTATQKIVIFYGSGLNKSFIPSTDFFFSSPRSNKMNAIAVVDINSDGFVDLVASAQDDRNSEFQFISYVNMGNR